MIIAFSAYQKKEKGNKRNNHMLDSLFFLASVRTEDQFFLISETIIKETQHLPPNVTIIKHSFLHNKGILGDYWSGLEIRKIISKIKADVLINIGGIYNISKPQILIAGPSKKPTKKEIEKAALIVVNSVGQKKEIVNKYQSAENKIEIIQPVIPEFFKCYNEEQKNSIKQSFTNNKDYFICTTCNLDEKSFYILLKSFSHFKKRLQSSMKLVLLAEPGSKLKNQLVTYKYRSDLIFPANIKETEEAALISASYGVIDMAASWQSFSDRLKAIKCGAPVISIENSDVSEFSKDTILFANITNEKAIGENMIQLYTDEKLRSRLIAQGLIVANNFTLQKAAEGLWNCIIRAVK